MKKHILCFALAFSALFSLMFKLPGVPELFGITKCMSCSTHSLFLPMLAAAYFAALCVAILCFHTLPTDSIKWAGRIWSVGLAVTLTWLAPTLCGICLFAHLSHITIWMIWKPRESGLETFMGVKISLIFFSAVAMAALFSTLNFSFLLYGLQPKNPLRGLVKEGTLIQPILQEVFGDAFDVLPHQGIVLNYLAANCPFCKEQLAELALFAQESENKDLRFINVSQHVDEEMRQLAPHLEWAEDHRGILLDQLGIQGFPTLILMDDQGKVAKTIAGTSTNLSDILKTYLKLS